MKKIEQVDLALLTITSSRSPHKLTAAHQGDHFYSGLVSLPKLDWLDLSLRPWESGAKMDLPLSLGP